MRTALIVAAALLTATLVVPAPTSAAEPDAGCPSDAADTFATASSPCGDGGVNCTGDSAPFHPDNDEPYRCWQGTVGSSDDDDDYYRIPLTAGDELVIDVYDAGFWTEVRMLDPNGVVLDQGTAKGSIDLAISAKRVEVERAHITGDYRLHISGGYSLDTYRFCIRPCEGPVGQQPNGLIWGPIRDPSPTEVLLIPPSHGDLGNPTGPTVADYLNETLKALHDWEWALDEFAQDYPEYSYLENVSVEVDIYDGASGTPVDPAGYDVVLGYVHSGPAFRGIAFCCTSLQSLFDGTDVDDELKFEGRYIALSLYGASPRGGQAVEDFPERNDLYGVTLHEFAHTWGVGHSLTWTETHGPDLMNSPATFTYGDGDPAGDGGERTPRECVSTLNLYAFAVQYDWMADGNWEDDGPGTVTLPSDIPYEQYCAPTGGAPGVLGAVPGV